MKRMPGTHGLGLVGILIIVSGCSAALAAPVPTTTATPPVPTTTATSPGARPLDLVFDKGFDQNGIPLNPRWGYQTPSHVDDPRHLPGCSPVFINDAAPRIVNPSCTSQSPSWDEPAPWSGNLFWCRGDGLAPGHSNWFPTTYTGLISWGGHSRSITDDDDYSMDLQTPDLHGALAGDGGHVHLEFNSDETIDNFGSSWWSAFHHAVDNSDTDPYLMIGGHPAIATGLMGIDWVHTPGAESHPVWALAIQASLGSWAFFVRNWGDEGYCSSDQQHTLDGLPGGGTYTFKLPWEWELGQRGQVVSIHAPRTPACLRYS
jgi:hypothetical protein